jgi:hypothetical protein
MDEADEDFDEQLLAEWAAAEAAALSELQSTLSELPDRPLPRAALRAACRKVRAVLARAGWPGDLLAACGGVDPARLPAEDSELWLTLTSGIVAPRDELARAPEPGDGGQDDELAGLGAGLELSEDEEALVALCALDLRDWLAVATALARGGPGTAAAPDALASYVSEFDPDDPDDQADAAAGMFARAVELWAVLGAVDGDGRLTPLGWWGIPDAVQRAWTPAAHQ